MKVQIIIIFLLIVNSLALGKVSDTSYNGDLSGLILERDSLANNLKNASLYEKSNIDSSLKFLKISLGIARRISDYKSQSKILSQLLSIYKNEGKTRKFSETQKEIIAVNKHLLETTEGRNRISLLSRIAAGYIDANTDSALYYFSKVISLAGNYDDFISEAEAYLNTGYIYAHIENNSKALDSYRTALNLFRKKDNKQGMAESYQAISKLFLFFGNYQQALDLEKEAADNYNEVRDLNGYYRARRHIGEIYLSMGNRDKSLKVLTEAVNSAKENKDYEIVSSLYQSMGNYYSTARDYDKAIKYLKKGLYLRTAYKEPSINIINNYNSLGDAYRNKEEYHSALGCYLKSIKLLNDLGNLIILSKTQNNLATTYASMGNYIKSIYYLKKSVKNAEIIGNRYGLLGSYSELISVYEKLNNYKYALKFFERYSVLKDSLEIYSNRNKIEQFKDIYEKEKKAKEIEVLKSEEQKIILTSIVAITLLSLIVLLVLLSRYRIKTKSNKQLIERTNKIADMLAQVNKLNISLKISEDTYRNLFEQNPMPMLIWQDETRKIIAANIAAVNHYGYVKDEFLSMTIRDLCARKYLPQLDNRSKLFGDTQERIPNIKHRKKNGDLIDVEILSHPFLFEGKEAHSVIIQDVTERKKVENEVMESEERYRNLFEGAPDAVILIDHKLRIIKDANPAATKLFRSSWADLIGTKYLQLFSGSKKQSIEEFFSVMDQNSKAEILETGIILGGNVKVPVEISGRLVSLPHFNVYQVNIRDITSRKETERELRKSEKRLIRTQKIAHVGNWELDLESQKIWISDEACLIIGIEETENYISIARMINIITVEDRPRFEFASKKLVNDGNEFDITYKIIKVNSGEIRLVHSRAELIKDETGKASKILGAIRDITELKKYQDELVRAKEEAELANKRKSDFLAQMSHEIRSPVNTILSFASLIRDELNHNASDDMKTCFNAIDNGGRRLIRTIDLVLNVADIQTGEYDIYLERTDLADNIIENLMLEFSSAAGSKELELKFINEIGNRELLVDRYTIAQIFANLIDNAIKYTRTGSITVRLSGDENSVNVCVEDTGSGISKEYLPYLFEPFTQEEQGYTRKSKGTGLGLSLVKRYCELNNASINVESEKGRGTKFTVSFKIPEANFN